MFAREFAVDIPLLALIKVAELQQAIDEKAQARLRRPPTSHGVRAVEQPQHFQIGHRVADRSRRKRQPAALGQRPRPHRLARRQVRFHDLAEDLARAGVERSERARWGGVGH